MKMSSNKLSTLSNVMLFMAGASCIMQIGPHAFGKAQPSHGLFLSPRFTTDHLKNPVSIFPRVVILGWQLQVRLMACCVC